MKNTVFHLLVIGMLSTACSHIPAAIATDNAVSPTPSATPLTPKLIVHLGNQHTLAEISAQSGLNLRTVQTLSGGDILVAVEPNQQQRDLQLSPSQLIDQALHRLRSLNNQSVSYVQEDYVTHLNTPPLLATTAKLTTSTRALTVNDPDREKQWWLDRIRAPEAWELTIGSENVVIATLDTGSTPHNDIENRILTGFDFVNNRTGSADLTVSSYNGHGSSTHGILGANTQNNLGVAGINWKSKILPIVVYGTGGTTFSSRISNGIRWAVGLPVSGISNNPNPAKVVYLAVQWETLCSQQPAIQAAINDAVALGATVIGAAGNYTKDVAGFTPGGCNNVVVVGALSQANTITSYSNFGGGVDISAPGAQNGDTNLIWTLGANHTYKAFSGTSASSPMVASVVGLMYAVNPKISPAQVESILRSTATPLGSTACPKGCGAGLLNAYGAVKAAMALTDTSAPTVSLNASSNNITTANPFTLTANATDNIGISKVEFYSGTTLINTDTSAPYSYSLYLTSANNGDKTFSAKAYDAVGNVKTSSPVAVTVNIATTSASLSLSSSASTVSSSGNLTLTASPSNFSPSKVEFYSGTTLINTDTSAPYSYSLYLTSANNGNKTFSAKAYTSSNTLLTSNSVNVLVNISSNTASAWASNVSYAMDSLVSHNGITYKCLQAHVSMLGWEPNVTPALWSRQ